MLATLLTTSAPLALGARSDIDLDVDADVDMSVAARAAARGEGRYTYSWDWGDGEASARAGAEARHAYRSPGVYRVVVTVSDEAGNEWRRTREVTVKAPPTEVEIERDGAEVEVEAEVDHRTRVTWDWGDGEVSTGRHARHRYERSGSYEVVATFERGSACWTEKRTVVVVAKEEGEEDDEDEEDDRHDHGLEVSVRPGVRVDASWRHGAREETARASSDRWSSSSEVSVSSYDRHDAPGAPVPLVLGFLGLAAVAGRRLLKPR